MSHMEYLSPCVEIKELICILNVVRSAVFVVIFSGYSIKFPPTVIHTQIEPSFCVHTSNKIHEYVTVHPTVILLCAKK